MKRGSECFIFFIQSHPRWKIIENEECYFSMAKSIRNYWKIDPNNFSMIGNSTWIIFRLKKKKKSFFNDFQTRRKTKLVVKQYFPSIYSKSTSNNSFIKLISTREKAFLKKKKKNCKDLKQFLNWTLKNFIPQNITSIHFLTTRISFHSAAPNIYIYKFR